ncbi:MAG TPA: Rne/Rng family ribonuclease [Gaiellaceae bacterium]|nr:Rne/Rng family ribonuclease [Gaiellaceae bacterium]
MPLPWFRRKQQEALAQSAAPQEAPPVEVAPPSTTTPAAPETGDAAAKPKRRRGSRGGRNRRKPASASAPETAERERQAPAKAARPAKTQKDGKPASDRKRSQPRRRQVSRRAPLPAAKRELLVSVDVSEKRVAVLEDGRVAEVYLERPERRSIAGNIYKGVVDNVLPGMEAAFVEIGLEKNGFLFVDEIVGPELEGRRPRGRRITDLISRGEEVLVQAVKDPMKTKGARLTTEISLPGRFVVFVPHGEGLGVSRRLEEDERDRLRDIVKDIAPKQGGVIVRTAAEGASADDVRLDLEFLMKLWKQIQTRAKASKPPVLVFQEAELPLRVTRDLFTGDFEKALVDDDRTLKRIQGYLKKTSPHMAERVSRYRDKVPLFEAYGVDAEIRSTLSRRVDLPSGGYLIFDYAEAFTVIDVNTGRFVGSRSKSSGARLEDTVTKNNLEAVKEVVRQLRLRDIGGIIVIDFIDMANPKNREAVEQALQQELERDRTKTYVVEISPLGLVEMTRQNVTDGPREILTRKCPTCAGEGVVVSEATAVVDTERKLRALAASKPRTKAFSVELNAHVGELLIGPGAARLQEIEAATRRRFFLVGKAGVPHEHFTVLDEGTVEKLEAGDSPLADGRTVELKLGEVGRYDVGAGVGKLDGLTVVVGGASKLVGKKVSARIGRVLGDVAYATLADAEAEPADGPITAEAQAEKPTRASRAKKPEADAAEPEAEAELEPEPEPELEIEAEVEVADEEPAVAEADGDGAGPPADGPPRKRTRRGSRGGRGRGKKPASEGAGDEAVEAIDEPEEQEAEPEEAATDQPAPRKKTRRGSRGGRGRRKPAAAAADGRPESDEPTPDAAAPGPSTPTIHVPDASLGEEVDSANGDQPAAPKKRTRRGSRGGRRRRKPAGATAEAAAEPGSDQG